MDDSGMTEAPHLLTANSSHDEQDALLSRDPTGKTNLKPEITDSGPSLHAKPETTETAATEVGIDATSALDNINSGATDTTKANINELAKEDGPQLLKAEQSDSALISSTLPPLNPQDMSAQAANVAQLASSMGIHDLNDYNMLTDQETQDLASVALSQASFGDQGVAPFALESNSSLPMPSGSSVHDDTQYFDGTSSLGESEAPRIQAFAKLEFDDGQFYMNTYAVELGRDIRATRVTSQRKEAFGKHGRQSSGAGSVSENVKRDMAGSIISERGGIMGLDSQSVDEPRKRKRGTKTKSTSSSSQHLSKRDSGQLANTPFDYQSLAMSSLQHSTAGAHPVDPISLLPSPDECPLIPIHPPALVPGAGTSQKSISRKHARIAYNFEKHLFEVEITGRNGAFVDEQWYPCSEVRPLKSGSNIQLGGVSIKFVLPDVALGETGAEGTYTSGGKGPAYGLGPARAQSMEMEDSDEADEDDDAGDFSRMDTVDIEDEDDEDDDEEIQVTPPPQPVPIKRGPGRPPKNGIMSKRQQRELEKAAKLKALEQNTPFPSTKGKVGRPEKSFESDSTQPKPEKRKYTKRKTADSQDFTAPAQASNSSAPVEARPAKEKKLPRPPRPPRSPSPVFDESKLTAADLAKPQVNYVVIIHDALSNSSTGTMSLPQIYRAIERKYPYFKLRVQTQGWQSSVRHNLSQNAAFQKVQRDGKGWMWGVVPGVSIEKEKRRRASPPQMPSHLQHQSVPASQAHPNPQQHRPSMAATHPHASNVAGTSNGNLQSNDANNVNATGYQSPYAIPAPPGNPTPSNGNTRSLMHNQQTAAQRPTPPPPRPPPQRNALMPERDILLALSSYKAALLNSLSNSPRAELLITSAINRALGLSDKSTATPEGQAEDPQERTFINSITNMIDMIKKKKAAAAKDEKKAEAQRVLNQAMGQSGGGPSKSNQGDGSGSAQKRVDVPNGMSTRSSRQTSSPISSAQQKFNGQEQQAAAAAAVAAATAASLSPAANGTAAGTKRSLEMLDASQDTDLDSPESKKIALSPAVGVGTD